jgi:hypothetical protein
MLTDFRVLADPFLCVLTNINNGQQPCHHLRAPHLSPVQQGVLQVA